MENGESNSRILKKCFYFYPSWTSFFPFSCLWDILFSEHGLEQGVSFCDIHYVFLISRFLFESCWLFLALHGSGAICILFLF